MRKRIRNLSERAVHRSRELRKGMSLSERRLWALLRGKQLGMKFRRQYGAGPYTLDFYCPKARLCVELDGDTHFTQPPPALRASGGWGRGPQTPFSTKKGRDVRRDAWLSGKGIKTLRVTTRDLFQNRQGTLEQIWRVCQERCQESQPPPVSSPFSTKKGRSRE